MLPHALKSTWLTFRPLLPCASFPSMPSPLSVCLCCFLHVCSASVFCLSPAVQSGNASLLLISGVVVLLVFPWLAPLILQLAPAGSFQPQPLFFSTLYSGPRSSLAPQNIMCDAVLHFNRGERHNQSWPHFTLNHNTHGSLLWGQWGMRVWVSFSNLFFFFHLHFCHLLFFRIPNTCCISKSYVFCFPLLFSQPLFSLPMGKLKMTVNLKLKKKHCHYSLDLRMDQQCTMVNTMAAQDASSLDHNSVDTVCQLCSPAIKVSISHFNQISFMNFFLASDLQVPLYFNIKAWYPDKYCICLRNKGYSLLSTPDTIWNTSAFLLKSSFEPVASEVHSKFHPFTAHTNVNGWFIWVTSPYNHTCISEIKNSTRGNLLLPSTPT